MAVSGAAAFIRRARWARTSTCTSGRRSPEPQTLRQRDHAALRPYRFYSTPPLRWPDSGEVSHMPTLRIPPNLELYYLVDNFADPWSNPATILMLHGNA